MIIILILNQIIAIRTIIIMIIKMILPCVLEERKRGGLIEEK